jgi:RNA polymerase sigma factor (sigma-70 family)
VLEVRVDTGATAAIAQAIAGDEAAFARIIATYHADLMRVAFVVCGDRELAGDAVEAAWTIAWRRLGTLRDPERLRPWLVAVAANEARQAIRREHRRAVNELRVEAPRQPFAHDPAAVIDRIDLVNALACLDAADRALLAMRYVVGLDATEIGAATGRSPSGTRARLARLLRRLRKELEG